MHAIYIIGFFIVGCILGSFFSYLGIQLAKEDEEKNTLVYCSFCDNKRRISERVPVISYLISKGKCKCCNNDLLILFPVVELLTGLLFSVSYYSFCFSFDVLISLGVVSLFMIILVSDLLYYIIPDEIIVFFVFYFVILQILKGGINNMSTHVVTGLFLFLLMYFIMVLGEKIFQKESLGGGDVKLMFIFGLVLEPLLGVFSIFLASVIALIPSIYILIKNKDHMIPFGPFLIISFCLIYFSKITDLDFLRFLGFRQF